VTYADKGKDKGKVAPVFD